MTDATQPTAPDAAEPEQTVPHVSPTAASGGPVSSELDGPDELDRAVQDEEEPTNVDRD